MPTDRLLDLEKTLLSIDRDATLLAKVAEIFVRTVPSLLEQIRTAVEAQDLKRAYADAHTLKGAVGVFNAPQVFQSVSDLAQHAKERDLEATASSFASMQPLVQRLLSEIEALASGSAAATRPARH